jgi:hypothetical protein
MIEGVVESRLELQKSGAGEAVEHFRLDHWLGH